MSGHSKFSNIKHRKEKNDAAKGRIFTRLGREIAVAVKCGGADPASNSKLKDIIVKAKTSNMPNDTIDRCIKKAFGDLNNVNYEKIVYEGYGPNGTAIIVETLTDNKNRTAGNVRSAFTKGGGNMGTTGCVSYMFDEMGQIMIESDPDVDEDELMLLCLESGASDFIAEEEGYEILTSPENFNSVLEAVENTGLSIMEAAITMIPQTSSDITTEDDIKKMRKIIDLLEDDDDVQNIYHNWCEG